MEFPVILSLNPPCTKPHHFELLQMMAPSILWTSYLHACSCPSGSPCRFLNWPCHEWCLRHANTYSMLRSISVVDMAGMPRTCSSVCYFAMHYQWLLDCSSIYWGDWGIKRIAQFPLIKTHPHRHIFLNRRQAFLLNSKMSSLNKASTSCLDQSLPSTDDEITKTSSEMTKTAETKGLNIWVARLWQVAHLLQFTCYSQRSLLQSSSIYRT